MPSACMYDLYTKKDRWNREAPMGTTGEQLRNAMYRMHGLRVFFTNGYYDTATHIGIIYYMLNHAGLPMDRVSLKGYPSGHDLHRRGQREDPQRRCGAALWKAPCPPTEPQTQKRPRIPRDAGGAFSSGRTGGIPGSALFSPTPKKF